MSDLSEGCMIKENEWKPQVPKARPSIRGDCISMPIETSPYFNRMGQPRTMHSSYTHLSTSDNSSTRSINASDESLSSEEYDEDSYTEYLQHSLDLERESSISPRVPKRLIHSATTSPRSSFPRNHSIKRPIEIAEPDYPNIQRHPKSASISYKILTLLGITVCGLAVSGIYIKQDNKTVTSGALNEILWESIQAIQMKFSHQADKLWEHASSGIHDAILHPDKPGIIILYGSNPDTINCLANSLGKLSGKILGTNDHLILKPNDFKHDVGEVIHDFKSKISQTKAVVIQDLLNINPEAFKAFHNFCDRENPLIEQAIYIITIIMDEQSKNDLYIVEKKLTEQFGKHIKKDILDPLITRVTDGAVLHVAPETIADC